MVKSDVFSFGILLFEIVSGRDVIDLKYSLLCIVDWVVFLVKCGEYGVICDLKMRNCLSFVVIRGLVVMVVRCV